MSYIEKFIRGCFVQSKYSPHSFLTAISWYFFGGLFIFAILLFGGLSKDSFSYQAGWIFCLIALMIFLIDLFGFFIKFWVDSDWPLLIMYLTSIANLYMVPFFTTILFSGTLKDLIISCIIVTASVPLGWLWLAVFMALLKIDPMDRPKSHPFLLFGFYWIIALMSLTCFVCLKITGNEIYGIYGSGFFMSLFSPFFFMHFTRVFDYWQAIPQDEKRYGRALTTLKAKEKTQKSRNRKSFN